jgi:hypothetical protein
VDVWADGGLALGIVVFILVVVVFIVLTNHEI